MLLKKLWNFFIVFLLLLLLITFSSILIVKLKDYKRYTSYGIETSATIQSIYNEENTGGAQYMRLHFVDYKYPVSTHDGHGSVTIKRHRIENISSRKYKGIDPFWLKKKVGDKIPIIYLAIDQTRHKLLNDGDPRKLNNLWAICLPLSMIMFLAVTHIFWSTFLHIYLSVALLFGTSLIPVYLLTHRELTDDSSQSLINWATISSSTALLLMYYPLKLFFKGTRTQGEVTDCIVSLASGRIPFFVRRYTYVYRDSNALEHSGIRKSFLLFSKKKPLGTRIKLIFNAKKPKGHLIVGIIK